jgi:hypothetical protein
VAADVQESDGLVNLREHLLAIDGIAAADLDGDHSNPAGVRVRLAPGADADAVGREVQRVLAEHGMRSHMTEPARDGQGQPEAAEPDQNRPVDTATSDPAVDQSDAPDQYDDEPLIEVSPATSRDLPPPPPGALRAVGGEVVRMPGVIVEQDPADDPVPGPGTPDRIASVAVEETRTGVRVRVSTELGRQMERSVSGSGPMVDVAIVEAVGGLSASPPPEVVAVNDHVLDGTDVVLVMVEHADGTRSAGSAVVGIGRPFAVGLAAWRAVSEQA